MTTAAPTSPPARVAPRSRLVRALRRLGLRILFWYALATVLLYVFQRQALYHPEVLAPAEFARSVQNRFGGRAHILPGFDAVLLEPAVPARATAILFHGNGGNGIDRDVLASRFLDRGLRLVFAEYPGYAARPGAPSENALVADALRLHDELRRRFPQEPLVAVGESLGSAVATQVAAARPASVAQLVLITPFAGMTEVAARRMPLFPVRWLLKDRYESARHLVHYHGPVLVLVADQDELVGAASGLALHAAAAARGPAQLVRIAGAGHNDWWSKMGSRDWTALLGPALTGPEAAPGAPPPPSSTPPSSL